MKQFIITLIAAVAGGATGAIVVKSSDTTPAPTDRHTGEIESLSAQVDTLELENRSLKSRVDSLERQPVLDATPVREDVAEVVAAPLLQSAELRQLIDAMQDPEAPLPANFRDEIGTVLKEIQDAERKQRDEEREKQREEAMERRIDEMAKELGLSAYQTEVLRDTVTDSQEAMRKMREDGMEGGFEGMREAMDAIRTQAKQSLSAVFTPAQMTLYDEKYGNSRALFGFGGRGGGFGGGFGGRGR